MKKCPVCHGVGSYETSGDLHRSPGIVPCYRCGQTGEIEDIAPVATKPISEMFKPIIRKPAKSEVQSLFDNLQTDEQSLIIKMMKKLQVKK